MNSKTEAIEIEGSSKIKKNLAASNLSQLETKAIEIVTPDQKMQGKIFIGLKKAYQKIYLNIYDI